MLARKFPEAKIAFSGGDAGILYTSDSEAIGAQRLLTDMGVAPDRLILEAAPAIPMRMPSISRPSSTGSACLVPASAG